MTMAFDLFTAARSDLLPQVNVIAQSYFTVDTASSDIAATWYTKNPNCLIIAAKDGVVHGYADFLPLTDDALESIKDRRLKEEDIGSDHILAPEHIRNCRGIYFAGIAVKNRKSVLAARCAAALLGGAAHMLENVYDDAPLEHLLANPTTFSGNKLTRRMGLDPISFQKLTISGMDLYMSSLDDARKRDIYALHRKYETLISSVSW
jgi:hypothetical protein